MTDSTTQTPDTAGKIFIDAQGAQGVQIGDRNIQHVNVSRTEIIYGNLGVDPLVYQFLRLSFLDVIPRSVHLFECRGVRAARGIPNLYTQRGHAVHVVAHVMDDEATVMPVNPTEFRVWRNLIEKEPVFLLHGVLRKSGTVALRMLCLHDWLLHDATRRPSWGTVSSFPPRAFRSVGAHGALFHRAVVQEVGRVTGSEGSIWRTLKDAGLIPVDEMTLLEFMEFGRFLEIPQPVFKRLAALGSPTDLVVDCIRRGRSAQDPVVDSWVSTLRELSRHEPAGFERRQFRRFVRFMEQRGQGVPLPRHSGQENGCWRVFTAMYPEVLDGLRHVIRTSSVGNDIAFAAALIPTLVLANDRVVSCRASSVLHELPDRKQDFPEYYVRREILRSMVEGGDRLWLPESMQMIATEGITGEEQRYLNSYGWTPELVEANIERKLNQPTLRDQQMREHLEVMGDVFARTRTKSIGRGRAY
jgi:hypothetical protein